MHLLESAINRYLALDPELPAKLEQFEAKIICLELIGIGQKFYLLPEGQHIDVLTHCDQEPDATLRGSPMALFKMGMQRDVAPLLLKGEVEIIGDMRLGRAFKAILAEMHIDWEEQLSMMTGDVAAHQIMKTARSLTGWGRRSSESLAMNLSEYLTEETRDVVTGAEIAHFCNQVDGLRMDIDRLEARVNRLVQRGHH